MTDTGPYGFPIELVELPVARFAPLDREALSDLHELIETLQVARSKHKKHGEDFIISAVVAAMGDDATQRLHSFLVATVEIDSRDLNAFCYATTERLLVVDPPRMKALAKS